MGYDISIMRYSPDLRKRVLDFIQAGGSKTEAAKRFNVGRTTIYKWLNAPDPFAYQRPGPRGPRSIDYDALKQHIADFPDQTLKERAVHFGVSTFCILKLVQFDFNSCSVIKCLVNIGRVGILGGCRRK